LFRRAGRDDAFAFQEAENFQGGFARGRPDQEALSGCGRGLARPNPFRARAGRPIGEHGGRKP
jgi:hypothetical protein